MEDSIESRKENIPATESLWTFESAIGDQLSLLQYTFDLARLVDETFIPVAIETLDHAINLPDTRPDAKVFLENLKSNYESLPKVTGRLGGYVDLMTETVVTRTVDNFLAYVSDLLAEVLRAKPEMLKSSDRIAVDELLNFTSMDELVDYIAERKVSELSLKGAKSLVDYFNSRCCFDLFPESSDRDIAFTMMAWRNVIVHHHGIVDRIFLSRVHGDGYILGEKLDLEQPSVWEDMGRLRACVRDIDRRAIEKWSLATPRTVEAREGENES